MITIKISFSIYHNFLVRKFKPEYRTGYNNIMLNSYCNNPFVTLNSDNNNIYIDIHSTEEINKQITEMLKKELII
ncbi:MAG: hypothetical protein ACOC2W_03745 [bacterium]